MGHRPDLIQPVIGFRQWHVHTGDDSLLSLGLGKTVWETGKNTAVCKRSPSQMGMARMFMRGIDDASLPADPPDHLAPAPECGCGLYALHSLGQPIGSWPLVWDPHVATGAVAMWGELEVHAKGVRAQFARVVALAWPLGLKGLKGRRARRVFRRVADNYGASVVGLEKLEEEAYKHGIVVPKELIPDEEPLTSLISIRQR